MKIGIQIGSFNPYHFGHEFVMGFSLDNYIDRGIIVPSYDSFEKEGIISFDHRLGMLREYKKLNKPIGDLIEISDIEHAGTKYTYDILSHYQSIFPKDEIYLLVGSDLFKNIENFYKGKDILEEFGVIVFQRPQHQCNILDIAHEITPNIKHLILAVSVVCQSSTNIRNEIKKGFVDSYVPKGISDYIKNNKLYGYI